MNKAFEDAIKKIENHKFGRPARGNSGYDAVEVDTFLSDVIVEYIKKLQNAIIQLEDENQEYETLHTENKKKIDLLNSQKALLQEELELYKRDGYSTDRNEIEKK
jgi:DivIVA domain-containing protein